MILDLNESEKQSLRIRRFAMGAATYCMVMIALFIVTQLGMGSLSPTKWGFIISLCLAGNCLFLFLFISGRNRRFSDPSLTSEQIIFAALWGMAPLWALPDARPVLLMFFLPAFGFGMLRLNLRQYLIVVISNMTLYGLLLTIEFSLRRPGFRLEHELFLFVLFGILLVHVAFFGGFISRMRKELKKYIHITKKVNQDLRREVDIRQRAEIEKDRLIQDLRNALGEIKTLSGLLPICSNCKKIRDYKGYWYQIEAYIREHSEAEFSHGICPDCAKELYPEYAVDG